MSNEKPTQEDVREARNDYWRANAKLWGFRIGVPITALAVITGIDERVSGGVLKGFIGDVTGFDYRDIDLTLTLLDAALLVTIIYLGLNVGKKLISNRNEERAEYREVRDDLKKS